MLSWFRRGDTGTPVLGLGEAAVLQALAEGFGEAARLRVHADAAALTGDAGFGRANLLLLAGPEAEAVALAGRLATARAGSVCEIAVLAEDPLVQIALRDLDAALPVGVRVRPVSRTVLLTRQMLSGAAPPDRVLRLATATDPQHLLIAGQAGPLAAQLLLESLRLLQLPGIRPAVTLAGPAMPALLARLRAGLPELDACGQLTATETRPEGDFAMAYALDDGVPASATVVVRPVLPGWPETAARLKDPAIDAIAQGIHELHLAERGAAGGRMNDRPSMAPWDHLPERFREASRHQARHIAAKLRWVGARVAAPGGPPFAWTARELAALTEAEHARWETVSRLEGWRFAPERDDVAKTTPLLVPFAELTPDIRDLDALPVRAAPRHAGPAVRRDLVVAVEPAAEAPGPGFRRALRTGLDALRGDGAVLRIGVDNALTRELAAVATEAGVPLQLTLAAPALASQAERIAIGAAAVQLLPPVARVVRLGADGQLR